MIGQQSEEIVIQEEREERLGVACRIWANIGDPHDHVFKSRERKEVDSKTARKLHGGIKDTEKSHKTYIGTVYQICQSSCL